MLSVLVAVVAIVVFFWERQSDAGAIPWVVLALGAFMIFGMWVFPEAKRDKRK
jgi:hypothetical protein